ncbi:hypothetical protein ACH4U6_27965 [Streptomyces netropsis]|uniref:hypothetical protein n=1 Tax=Streptomyces netropsis TaxID=55404 RepID=UPI00379D6CF0
MRMLVEARLDTRAGNEAIKNGKLPKVLQDVMEAVHPEAAYFAPMDGGRACMMVFDMQDSSQMPPILEAFFTELEAEVHIQPVMNYEDLQKGLAAAGRI